MDLEMDLVMDLVMTLEIDMMMAKMMIVTAQFIPSLPKLEERGLEVTYYPNLPNPTQWHRNNNSSKQPPRPKH